MLFTELLDTKVLNEKSVLSSLNPECGEVSIQDSWPLDEIIKKKLKKVMECLALSLYIVHFGFILESDYTLSFGL
ncbi:MAG TPA: hypothetical protein DEF18_01370 [Muricauda sp.]|nr:hypothetical protein [Allomuricauda sp.]MBC72486.1 hypothetical protein [Allomuricauda sp.]HBU76729.1 hypothetical protein [Allomuricauda sp.]